MASPPTIRRAHRLGLAILLLGGSAGIGAGLILGALITHTVGHGYWVVFTIMIVVALPVVLVGAVLYGWSNERRPVW